MADIFVNLWQGTIYAVSPMNILAIIIGYAIGVVAGAIPGVMAVTAMVLILPFTFTLDPLFAIALLMGVYKGGAYAGSITATLVNIPGTPGGGGDRPGQLPDEPAGRAAAGPGTGPVGLGHRRNHLQSVVGLHRPAPGRGGPYCSARPRSPALILFSLTAVITLLGDSLLDIWKGFISITVGLILALIGLDNMSATRRYVFNFEDLDNGVPFVLTIIALLALSEVFIQSERVKDLHIEAGLQRGQADPLHLVPALGRS